MKAKLDKATYTFYIGLAAKLLDSRKVVSAHEMKAFLVTESGMKPRDYTRMSQRTHAFSVNAKEYIRSGKWWKIKTSETSNEVTKPIAKQYIFTAVASSITGLSGAELTEKLAEAFIKGRVNAEN